MEDRELLRRIGRSAGQSAGYKQLVRELGLGGGRERRLLVEQLDRLTVQGELIKIGRDQWALPTRARPSDLVAGKLDMHRDGYGFVRPEPRQGAASDDIFIPPNEIGEAMQGDHVLVELAPSRPDGRRSGRIVRVLVRRNPTVVGVFRYAQNEQALGNTVLPWDERITQTILIPFGSEIPLEREVRAADRISPTRISVNRVMGRTSSRQELERESLAAAEQEESLGAQETGFDLEGMVVDVEVTSWPTANRPARGRVIEILGRPDDFGIDVEIVIRKHHLPHVFPESVLHEARAVATLDTREAARRRDFRELPIVTIDGETAKDFDDAVYVERDRGEWELQVHIADVAQYVTEGSLLDLEARLRGTSVYFPDRAVPMLPQELSSDICSLRPEEDRLVLSCIMRLDASGEILDYEICEGVIRSARRMTYTQVHAILEGEEKTRAEFAPLVNHFEDMRELARVLYAKRQRRGSIDFDLPEPVIEFDPEGEMQSIVRSERSWANRLIEEFMLSANECVATWLEELGVPSLYRIHEPPEGRRVAEFEDIAAAFGYSLGVGPLPVKRIRMKSDIRSHQNRSSGSRAVREHEIASDIPVTPQMYQRLAQKISGKPEERILAHLMLRSLRQARYSEKNEGHFALAAPCYTHFTSPIRRYPDLIVHRIAKAILQSESGRGGPIKGGMEEEASGKRPKRRGGRAEGDRHHPAAPLTELSLAEIALESSQAERRAEAAERELMEWKKVRFMQDRLGEEFTAIILSVTRYGCFVELDSLFVEGLVPIASLEGDLFTYRENTRQIIGERSGRRYSLGDRVIVALDRVDLGERRLQFSMVEELPAARSRKPAKDSAKPRAKASSGLPSHSAKAHPYRPPKTKALGKKRRQRGKKKRR